MGDSKTPLEFSVREIMAALCVYVHWEMPFSSGAYFEESGITDNYRSL
jgi:hypothetical protein